MPVKTPAIGLNPTALTFNATEGGANPAPQTVAVSNVGQGGSTLNWSQTDNASWLTVTPASGTNSGTLTVQPATGALVAGTYNATITVSASGASNTPQTVAVTFVVGAPVVPASGPIAQTLPGLSQAATASASAHGPAASGLPALAQAGAGTLDVAGTAAGALPALGQAAAGTSAYTQPVDGTASQALPALGAQAAGMARESGAASSPLPGLSSAAFGAVLVTGAAGGMLGALAQAAGGELLVAGDGASALAAPSSSASGSVIDSSSTAGAAAQTLPALGVVLEGLTLVAGDGASILQAPFVDAAGGGPVAPVEYPETLRDCLLSMIRLPALVGAEIGLVSTQYVALTNGLDVEVTAEQLQALCHPCVPANADEHAAWTLRGDNDLTPV